MEVQQQWSLSSSAYQKLVGKGRHKATQMNIKEHDASMEQHIASRDCIANPIPILSMNGEIICQNMHGVWTSTSCIKVAR